MDRFGPADDPGLELDLSNERERARGSKLGIWSPDVKAAAHCWEKKSLVVSDAGIRLSFKALFLSWLNVENAIDGKFIAIGKFIMVLKAAGVVISASSCCCC